MEMLEGVDVGGAGQWIMWKTNSRLIIDMQSGRIHLQEKGDRSFNRARSHIISSVAWAVATYSVSIVECAAVRWRREQADGGPWR